MVPVAGFALAAILVALAVVPGRLRTDASAAGPCDPTTAAIDSAEQRMLDLIAQARRDAGVAPYRVSNVLNRAAAWKSEDAARIGSLSHPDSLGRDPFDRMEDCGDPTSGWSENVGIGSDDADAMFHAFMNSDGHRRNILDANAKSIGVGRHAGHWTLDFSRWEGDSSEPPTPPTGSATQTPTRTATPSATPTATPTQPPSQLSSTRKLVIMLSGDGVPE
jgi:cell division septation protein DedD